MHPPTGRRALRWSSLVRCVGVLGSLCFGHLSPLLAQGWNDSAAVALVRRAAERRRSVQADSGLASYRTRAHGFVFFLGQVGAGVAEGAAAGVAEPPRLIKADELDVEVYWRAPDRSKQVILGWRDGTFLPTDIHYHRDHLGIVVNNFGDVIRIGEGDEVRDAVHPLSPAGLDLYEFARGDSLAVTTATGRLVVHEVRVRPRDFGRPLVVGTLFLDVATAELVRFRFSFTPAAYLDTQLEDITVDLENSLYEQRYWLPYRQEVQIRRRTSWLDFPARGIIRARWEIGDYELNAPVPPAVLAGPAVGGLRQPRPGDSAWTNSLERAIADVAVPVNRQDMASLRSEVERIAAGRPLGGLPARRLSAGSLSDLVRVNRVQGLTLGFGGMVRPGRRGPSVRAYLAYGTADDRLTGSVTATRRAGAMEFRLAAARRIEDIGDLPVIAPVLNSILAQEGGNDYGDYVLLHRVELGVRRPFGGRTAGALALAVEDSRSVGVEAEPASGSFRLNPPLGAGSYRMVRLALERSGGGIAVRRDFQGRVAVEAGEGDTEYIRATVDGRWLAPLGTTELLSRAYLGVGSKGTPPHRQVVLGGRGTLVGEPFRAYGGRAAALAHLEWRFRAPVPAIPLGSFASTGRQIVVAPFVAAGWTARPVAGSPWTESDGARPVAGVAVEWFMRLIRLEAGVGLRTGEVGVTLDISREWWGLL
jgi:hypothetical protein